MEQIARYDCPICGVNLETRNRLRSHLHVSHRKSLIIDAYLDAIDELKAQ